jgi:hypothetical protein
LELLSLSDAHDVYLRRSAVGLSGRSWAAAEFAGDGTKLISNWISRFKAGSLQKMSTTEFAAALTEEIFGTFRYIRFPFSRTTRQAIADSVERAGKKLGYSALSTEMAYAKYVMSVWMEKGGAMIDSRDISYLRARSELFPTPEKMALAMSRQPFVDAYEQHGFLDFKEDKAIARDVVISEIRSWFFDLETASYLADELRMHMDVAQRALFSRLTQKNVGVRVRNHATMLLMLNNLSFLGAALHRNKGLTKQEKKIDESVVNSLNEVKKWMESQQAFEVVKRNTVASFYARHRVRDSNNPSRLRAGILFRNHQGAFPVHECPYVPRPYTADETIWSPFIESSVQQPFQEIGEGVIHGFQGVEAMKQSMDRGPMSQGGVSVFASQLSQLELQMLALCVTDTLVIHEPKSSAGATTHVAVEYEKNIREDLYAEARLRGNIVQSRFRTSEPLWVCMLAEWKNETATYPLKQQTIEQWEGVSYLMPEDGLERGVALNAPERLLKVRVQDPDQKGVTFTEKVAYRDVFTMGSPGKIIRQLRNPPAQFYLRDQAEMTWLGLFVSSLKKTNARTVTTSLLPGMLKPFATGKGRDMNDHIAFLRTQMMMVPDHYSWALFQVNVALGLTIAFAREYYEVDGQLLKAIVDLIDPDAITNTEISMFQMDYQGDA